MNTSRALWGLSLIILAAAGCGPAGPCGHCDRDSDCEPGLSCVEFTDGSSSEYLCADETTSNCTIDVYY
jgi:hypothetical protein